MCGIVGFVGSPYEPDLISMRETMRHRGPDGKGLFIKDGVSLAHRRLSILDLRHGGQPMSNEDGTVTVVFNGEIYNYQELRTELVRLGYAFDTRCDTESIIHAYEEYGFESVDKLDGMFAFVLYDSRKRLIFGARDRMGKKPLFYANRTFSRDSGVEFAFASEIKAIIAHPHIRPELRISNDALLSYLLNDYIPGELSVYKGISKLMPGSAFSYGLKGSLNEGFKSWRYWQPNIVHETSSGFDDEEVSRRVVDLLSNAVERRLMSDVPLGLLLSGGIDSSTILGLMARFLPPSEIKTFSIAFDVESFDESSHAQQVADHFGTQHYVKRFTTREMLSRLDRVLSQLDEPFADPSMLPVSLLCEFAREQVTVALSGDGGDELFAGYDPFKAVIPAQWYKRLMPRYAHRWVAQPLARLLPANTGNMSLQFKLSRFLRGAMTTAEVRSPVWMAPFTIEQLSLLAPDLVRHHTVETAYAPTLNYERNGQDWDDLDDALSFFQQVYLPDDILVKADRASMMHSLEIRCPFLDTALVEYVNSLPNSYKLRRGKTKYILRKAVCNGRRSAPLIPKSIANRKKKGFGIPVAQWIRKELSGFFYEVLIANWPQQLAMFDQAEIERLYNRHLTGRDNHYKELWALFVLASWIRTIPSVNQATLSLAAD